MEKKLFLSIIYEIIWFLLAIGGAYICIVPIQDEISRPFFQFLLFALFIAFTYFRFIAFMMRSILLESIWAKLLLFVLNVPLFFLLLNKYYAFGRTFDDYVFTLPANVFQHIKSGTDIDDLMYIKNLVTFAGVTSMTVIVLLEMRIVYAIFKLRQLDKILYKKK